MRNKNLIGTGVALITPFNDDFSIDFLSLEKLIENMIENRVNYLVVMGTTAESPTLSSEEQIDILNFVKKIVNNRVPIVFGMGSNDTNKLLKRIKNFDFDGIEAILSVCPYYNKPNQTGLFSHFDTIAMNCPVDIILYNVPSRTSSNLDFNTVKDLSNKHRNIIGIKEASGDIGFAMDLFLNCPKDFMIISGDDKITYPMIALGGAGVISVQAMAFPNLFVKMVDCSLSSDFMLARSYHYELLKSVDLFYIDGNPAGIKEALFFKNICRTNQLRLPLTKMKKENALLLHKFLK
ncbi:MAG: 4-hydroxy-tetrahydrodipicolinate synthase [Bacteroidota bacterium]|nr:4-hydroxy-tetrahydrodipicolinate synthase [Bacteroidota bacterium]